MPIIQPKEEELIAKLSKSPYFVCTFFEKPIVEFVFSQLQLHAKNQLLQRVCLGEQILKDLEVSIHSLGVAKFCI